MSYISDEPVAAKDIGTGGISLTSLVSKKSKLYHPLNFIETNYVPVIIFTSLPFAVGFTALAFYLFIGAIYDEAILITVIAMMIYTVIFIHLKVTLLY